MPPTQLLASLDSLRRRARSINVLYGVAVVLLIGCAMLFGGGLVDYLLRLPGVPRLLGLLTAFGALAYLGYRFVYKPAVARLTLGDVAGRVEAVYPQFEDRLRSSVQFLGEGSDADPLRRRAVEQAGDIARGVDFDDVLVTKPAYLTAAGAVAAVAVLTLLGVLLGPLAGVIAGRIFDPLNAAHQYPKTYEIAPLSLADRVPAGQSVPVTMSLTKGSGERVNPVVYYALDDGQPRQLLMTRQTDGTFSASVDTRLAAGAASGSLKVWVEAGDDATKPKVVTVVPQLAVTGVTAQVVPPPYVPNGKPQTLDLANGPVVTAAGSTVTLRATFNKALAKANPIALQAVGDAAQPNLQWNASGDNATATFTADQTLRFTLTATDRDGFTGESPQAVEVVVRPDALPGVTIENPRRSESRTAAGVVPLVATVDDDYGFRDVSLVARKLADAKDPEATYETVVPLFGTDGAAGDVTATPAGEAADRVRLRLAHNWDLSKIADPQGIALQPGDVLEYFVRATDNYERDGQYHEPVESGKLRITIISQEELSQQVIKDLRNVKDQIAATKQGQDRTKRETAELAESAKDKPQLDNADRQAAERLSRQQSATAAGTKRLGDKVAEIGQRLEENKTTADDLKQLTAEVEKSLNDTAESPMKRAAADLEQAKAEQASGEQAKDALGKSGDKQADASERLRKTMDKMDQIGSLRSTLDEVASLLAEQKKLGDAAKDLERKNLGKTPDQMTAGDQKSMQDSASKQEELAKKTDAAIDKMKKSAEEMKDADPAASESMSKAAKAGQQQQTSQQQRQAAAAQKQNQQSQAQRARQQAEIGLQLMLQELKEGEKRKLLELQKKLAEMQEQVARLVKRQAGHNLDNRDLAGKDVKTDAFAELRELSGMAGDAPAELVKATLPRLSAGQEQTERNTRDLSKTAEELPEGGDIANALTRAAARMERAAVFLRQKQLDAGYDPPQVEALDALRIAQTTIDEQKAAVDKELGDQARETIRQKLVEIRKDQAEKINAPTGELQAKRDAGTFKVRPDQLQLNGLPPAQGDLAGQIDGLSEPLADVGGVAFVYANKEVKGAMDGVQGRLADGETGGVTQIEQKRVLAGLDAMIESLQSNPKQDRFAQNGGGGQCNGKPALPPEAELRLIKKLQESVNDATAELSKLKADEAKQPNKPDQPPVGERVADVGGQQGDLRGVLDQMLQKYSKGQIKLPPEPAPEKEPVVGVDKLDEGELKDDLLGQNAGQQGEGGDAARVGDRMARSKQRLTLSRDPGEVTQTIQERILGDLDGLIEASRQQQAQSKPNPQQQQQQQAQRPKPGQKPGEKQANNQGQNKPKPDGQSSAKASTPNSPTGEADASGDLKEGLAEWGQLTPRQRAAVLDTKGEQVLDSYRKIIEDYYKRLNEERTKD